MTTKETIPDPSPEQDTQRDSGFTAARDPSLRPKAPPLSRKIRALLAFEVFVLGIATYAYMFGVRPQVKDPSYLLPIDALFFCGVCTVTVLLALIVALLNRNPPASP